MRNGDLWLLVLGATLGSCSCSSAEYRVRIDLVTDLVLGEEFDSVETTFARYEGREAASMASGSRIVIEDDYEATDTDDFVQGENVAELVTEAGVGLLEVSLLRGVQVVAIQTVLLEVREDVGLTVFISRNCASAQCADNERCEADGTCIAVSSEPDEPSTCALEACPAPAGACARASCRENNCFQEAIDDACEDGQWCNPEVGCLEVGTSSADAGVDASMDAGPSTCPIFVDTDTVALYALEDLAVARDEGPHQIDGSYGDVPIEVPGPTGCGNAVRFPTSGRVRVPDHSELRLAVGSIDFFMLVPNTLIRSAGIVSRDAQGQSEPGHLTIFLDDSGSILVVRFQGTEGQAIACSSAAVPVGSWMHVGVNFGGGDIELYIDGVLQAGTQHRWLSAVTPCSDSLEQPIGVEGNMLDWYFGASQASDDVASPDVDLDEYFSRGQLDQIRFSSVQRDFEAFAEWM